MVSFCENKTDCRRALQLSYFGENFNREICKANKATVCDNCSSSVCIVVCNGSGSVQWLSSLLFGRWSLLKWMLLKTARRLLQRSILCAANQENGPTTTPSTILLISSKAASWRRLWNCVCILSVFTEFLEILNLCFILSKKSTIKSHSTDEVNIGNETMLNDWWDSWSCSVISTKS